MMTRKEYQELQPYEADFRRAVNSSYKLPTPVEEDNKVIEVLLKYEPQTHVNRRCSNCMFNIYKRCGWLYYRAKEQYESLEQEKTRRRKNTSNENGR